MANREYVNLGDMAREIKSHVCEKGLEKGTMHYTTESSKIGRGIDVTFTYTFLNKNAKDKTHINRDDNDFQEYINNLGKQGTDLLTYQLGRNLEVISSEAEEGLVNITVSGQIKPGHKAKDPLTEKIARIELEKINRILNQ